MHRWNHSNHSGCKRNGDKKNATTSEKPTNCSKAKSDRHRQTRFVLFLSILSAVYKLAHLVYFKVVSVVGIFLVENLFGLTFSQHGKNHFTLYVAMFLLAAFFGDFIFYFVITSIQYLTVKASSVSQDDLILSLSAYAKKSKDKCEKNSCFHDKWVGGKSIR